MVYGEWCILFGALLIVTDTTGVMDVVKYKMLKFWIPSNKLHFGTFYMLWTVYGWKGKGDGYGVLGIVNSVKYIVWGFHHSRTIDCCYSFQL